MSELRNAVLQFSQLKFSKKLEIAGRLELLEDFDTFVPDFERFRRIFDRAVEQGKLDTLIKDINNARIETAKRTEEIC